MFGNEADSFSKSSIFDEDDVLWAKVNSSANYKLKKEINGKFYIPHRRVYSDSSKLENELLSSGFKIIFKNGEASEEDTDSGLYQVICKRA